MAEMKQRRTATKTNGKSKHRKIDSPSATLSFGEHLNELRRRLVYVAVSIGIWGGLAYGVEHHIVDLLLRPAHGQEFIYTSPLGGVDFLFRLVTYVGIAFSIPVIVYQILKYVEPLITKDSTKFIALGSACSGILALAGILFGYFIGLPAAMEFLLHQFVSVQIQPMLTIQAYMSFVLVYMFGSAMLFQLPLILIFINRIKPLKPKTLFRYERWVILLAFIISGLMNPTPNLLAQLLVAGPIIVMYQVGIVIIALVNRKRSPSRVQQLLEQDRAAQAERQARLQNLRALWDEAEALGDEPNPLELTDTISKQFETPAIEQPTKITVPAPPVAKANVPQRARPVTDVIAPANQVDRSRKYVNSFIDMRPIRSMDVTPPRPR